MLLVLALAGATIACDEEAARPHDTRVEQGLQQVLDGAVAKPGVMFPGVVAHYRDGRHAPWSGSAGLGDVDHGVRMRPGDRVRAGSILKTFVATVTLQLVEEGKLSLDATLPQLLPAGVSGRVANADSITLRMLLGHTSGVPEWITPDVDLMVAADPAHVWTTDEALALSAREPAWFPPGTSWRYSNTNYVLVGLVLEQVGGGKSWRSLVRERIFARVGLTGSFLPEPGDKTALPGETAHGYHIIPGGAIDLTYTDSSMAGASGGNALATTAEDLARFLEALLAGRLFTKPETLTAMSTMIEAPHESGIPHRYGLGLESFDLPNGDTVIGHSGGAAGYAAMMFRVPARDATFASVTNTSDLFGNALEVYIPALDVIAGRGQTK